MTHTYVLKLRLATILQARCLNSPLHIRWIKADLDKRRRIFSPISKLDFHCLTCIISKFEKVDIHQFRKWCHAELYPSLYLTIIPIYTFYQCTRLLHLSWNNVSCSRWDRVCSYMELIMAAIISPYSFPPIWPHRLLWGASLLAFLKSVT